MAKLDLIGTQVALSQVTGTKYFAMRARLTDWYCWNTSGGPGNWLLQSNLEYNAGMAVVLTASGVAGVLTTTFATDVTSPTGAQAVLVYSFAGSTPAISDVVAANLVAMQIGNWGAAGWTADPLLAAAVVAALSGVGVSLTSPVAADGAVSIVRGDDYLATQTPNRSLQFNFTGATLTGNTLLMSVRAAGDGALGFTSAGVVTSASACYFLATSAQTSTLVPGANTYNYDLQATDGSGHIQTLQRGQVTVLQDQTHA